MDITGPQLAYERTLYTLRSSNTPERQTNRLRHLAHQQAGKVGAQQLVLLQINEADQWRADYKLRHSVTDHVRCESELDRTTRRNNYNHMLRLARILGQGNEYVDSMIKDVKSGVEVV